ncbi:MAG: hypothetical protein JXR75_11570 [Rhodobacteraceae bacterium]|nr:hypothetical protein [Paracoccaceae bacterium]
MLKTLAAALVPIPGAVFACALPLLVILTLPTGQYTLVALNDPLFRGDSLLGLSAFYVSFEFLADQTMMSLVCAAQFAAILGAHLLALRLVGPVRPLAHVPMTGLMLRYPIPGLWLLSTARTG